MIGLQRGDQVMAAPIYLPADPEIGASAVPAEPVREISFVRNTEVLLREAHDGPTWPAVVAYSSLAVVLASWLALLALAANRICGPAGGGTAAPPKSTPPRSERRPELQRVG